MKTDHEREYFLLQRGTGPSAAIIEAAYGLDVIWWNMAKAYDIAEADRGDLRSYILRNYQKDGTPKRPGIRVPPFSLRTWGEKPVAPEGRTFFETEAEAVAALDELLEAAEVKGYSERHHCFWTGTKAGARDRHAFGFAGPDIDICRRHGIKPE